MGTCNDYDTGLTNVELAIRRADILASKERIRLANERAAKWARWRFVAAAIFCAVAVGNLIGCLL